MLLFAAYGNGIERLVSGLPKRFTYSDRIQNFATEQSIKLLSKVQSHQKSC